MPNFKQDILQAEDGDAVARAVRIVLSEYMAFVAKTPPEDERTLAARHMAGRAAVGHLAALVKLLKDCRAPGPMRNEAQGEDIPGLISAARKALAEQEGRAGTVLDHDGGDAR